jgi:hypothetical protein
MALFKKRFGGNVKIQLDPNRLANSVEYNSDDVKPDLCVIGYGTHYNLLYRDGEYLGIPHMNGGAIYPFAPDPRKKGSNGQKKKFSEAKVVAIPKDFEVLVKWGSGKSAYFMNDPKTGEPRYVNAHGTFYVNIDPTDSAHNANLFYSKILQNRNLEEFKLEQLREFLQAAFLNRIGAVIQSYVEEESLALDPEKSVPPAQMVKMSEAVCGKIKDIFAQYGLTINELSSSGSIVEKVVVTAEDPALKFAKI